MATKTAWMDKDEVVSLWLSERLETQDEIWTALRQWTGDGPRLTEGSRHRLTATLEEASGGSFDSWRETPLGLFALALVLDQFPRILYSGSATAFQWDAAALSVAMDGRAVGADKDLPPLERILYLLPFMHAENLNAQRHAVAMAEEIALEAPQSLRPVFGYVIHQARLSHETIARFGRFPTRNAVLGRFTTPEEGQFLAILLGLSGPFTDKEEIGSLNLARGWFEDVWVLGVDCCSDGGCTVRCPSWCYPCKGQSKFQSGWTPSPEGETPIFIGGTLPPCPKWCDPMPRTTASRKAGNGEFMG